MLILKHCNLILTTFSLGFVQKTIVNLINKKDVTPHRLTNIRFHSLICPSQKAKRPGVIHEKTNLNRAVVLELRYGYQSPGALT